VSVSERAASRPTVQIRKATSSDVEAIATTLARAFHGDPIMSWIFPDERRRPAILRAFFAMSAGRIYLRYGETYVHGDHVGAALWAPPGKWKLGTLDIIRNAGPLARVMRTRLVPGLRALLLAEKKHPHEPHAYLAVLGTAPDHQNEGIGSALLSHMLTRCDAVGLPAYLEASSEDSKRLYLRHGFRVDEEVPLPGGGPPFWRMWRDARAGA
jgi:ribosomal protein S18 acetylase RimI-like enzyme